MVVWWSVVGCWLLVGWWLVVGWLLVGWWLVVAWLLVGWWLVVGWLVVGWLLFGWRLVVVSLPKELAKHGIYQKQYDHMCLLALSEFYIDYLKTTFSAHFAAQNVNVHRCSKSLWKKHLYLYLKNAKHAESKRIQSAQLGVQNLRKTPRQWFVDGLFSVKF